MGPRERALACRQCASRGSAVLCPESFRSCIATMLATPGGHPQGSRRDGGVEPPQSGSVMVLTGTGVRVAKNGRASGWRALYSGLESLRTTIRVSLSTPMPGEVGVPGPQAVSILESPPTHFVLRRDSLHPLPSQQAKAGIPCGNCTRLCGFAGRRLN